MSVFALACTGSTSTVGPTQVKKASPFAFDAAEMQPEFSHGSAVWPGVSLLDHDGDGWLDISFTNGLNLADSLDRNSGDGSFTGVAAEARHLGHQHRTSLCL
jgi:hypothetical protein